MPLKIEELLQLKIHQLHEELGNMTRPQLQSLAKKCGLKANQRTLELTGCLAEYIIKEKRAKGGAAGTPYSTHKTPYNPIFNPRYAPTDTKKALQTRGSDALSTGKATGGKEWHLTKSKELAELEAALKTMPPPQQTRGNSRRVATPSTTLPSSSANKAGAAVTGKKRKHDDSAVTPAEHPLAKRQPSTTPYANTVDLRRAIIRRPGAPKPPPVPSRLGRTPAPAVENEASPCTTSTKVPLTSNKKVKLAPSATVMEASTKKTSLVANARAIQTQNTPLSSRNAANTVTPSGSVARKPTMQAISSAKSRMGSSLSNKSRCGRGGRGSSSTSLRVAAAIRATQAHEAYIARMRKAQQV